MSNFTTKDGVEIYYKDWGKGQPIVFSHGWPLSSDAWDPQMLFFGQLGYRVIAHDRRGHGRSEQTWDGNDMDTYADDLAQLIEKLDLKDAILVGHSTGGGEVAHYIGRHGSSRVAKIALVSAVPPLMLKSESNPYGVSLEALDGIRKAVMTDRSQFYVDFPTTFFAHDASGGKPTQGQRDSFWALGMAGSIKGQYDCVKQFSETDFHEDLARIDIPALVLHSEDDQVVPFKASGEKTAKLIKGAKLVTYKGFSHAMPVANADVINKDLLEFFRS
ncbi:alpha/beta fold hydrolase [Terriglobus tenax]|uniref:alpha/beta fold hydrolase n=1 Tax=Terriglobus tenax TaxID=1111115 RepID=UPI0021DF6B8D|nr:alpha/beta hydrolase [Terriglobus tenax]